MQHYRYIMLYVKSKHTERQLCTSADREENQYAGGQTVMGKLLFFWPPVS